MIDTPIPRRLKEARQRRHVSQKTLGIQAGIDEFSASPRMNQYEKGVHTPDYQTVARIAQQLQIPDCYFYCKDDDMASLILYFSRLNAEQRREMLSDIRRRLSIEKGDGE
jgi:transcriptional regulator with XRE-family HTH domain